MKKTRAYLLILLGIAITITACKKEDPIVDVPATPGTTNPPVTNPPADPTGDPIALKNFFIDNEKQGIQQFSIDVANPQLITGNGGLQLQFYPNAFETAAGASVTGNVDIELIEIYEKTDMILMNKPTMGQNWNGLAPLVSAGEFKITASQNGNELELKQWNSYSATIPAANGIDPNMELFYGSNANDTLIWVPADSSLIGGQGNAYTALFDSLGWINCDIFMNDPNPLTNVDVEIPTGFTNQTCALYVSFDGLNSVTSFYNYANSIYSSGPSYQLPTGLNVHFIAVAVINNVPNATIVSSTITANHYEIIPALTATTLAQLTADIQALP